MHFCLCVFFWVNSSEFDLCSFMIGLGMLNTHFKKRNVGCFSTTATATSSGSSVVVVAVVLVVITVVA